MIRILHVDSGREWRGGQNQVRLLTRQLAGEAGVAQVLVTKRRSELARRAVEHGVAVRDTAWSAPLDPRALWRLYREMVRFQPDIVHAHEGSALQLAFWARRLARGGPGAPALVATRRVDFHLRYRGSVWLRVDRVIAISEAVRRILLQNGVPPQHLAVVHDGIDPDEVRRAAAAPLDIRGRLGLPPLTPVAVNVAALVPHKDHATLIRAAHAARATRPDLHWVVAGEGELRRPLEAQIVRLGLEDRVHLLGYVPAADALIREADLLVMSSRDEGLGSVVLHALALGKPVVATRAGGLPEIVPEESLVPVGDAEALGRRVIATLTDPHHAPFPPEFTAAAMGRGVLAVYRSLLPAPRGTRT